MLAVLTTEQDCQDVFPSDVRQRKRVAQKAGQTADHPWRCQDLQYFLQQIKPRTATPSNQGMGLMCTWYSYSQTWSEHENFYPEQCAKGGLSALLIQAFLG